ncbi:MAG: hypothetical protein NTY08_18895 [Proteobacteria bacterium]|nr:hypothetical protein [Pseudomonadota bacterium]
MFQRLIKLLKRRSFFCLGRVAHAEFYIWSRDPVAQKRGRIHALEWDQGIDMLMGNG